MEAMETREEKKLPAGRAGEMRRGGAVQVCGVLLQIFLFYKFNPVVTHSLKAAWFQPLAYRVRTRFQAFAFTHATCTATSRAGTAGTTGMTTGGGGREASWDITTMRTRWGSTTRRVAVTGAAAAAAAEAVVQTGGCSRRRGRGRGWRGRRSRTRVRFCGT
jgi:hypothetical protein